VTRATLSFRLNIFFPLLTFSCDYFLPDLKFNPKTHLHKTKVGHPSYGCGLRQSDTSSKLV
jgi:hypothetical protein